jgi:hypothetical protein
MMETVTDHQYPTKDEDPYAPTVQRNVPRIGVIVEYKTWEKIATVHFQDTGEVGRVRIGDVELIKRKKDPQEPV